MAATTGDFDDGQELPDTTFGARYINNAYQAYRQYAGNRDLQVKQYIPTSEVVWETYFEVDWNFDTTFQTILDSTTAPTLATLKSLPEFSPDDQHAFSVYILILEKVDTDDQDVEDVDTDDQDVVDSWGDLPLVYVGTGTKSTTGAHERFQGYDDGEGFSSLTKLAHQHGYHITHKKILVSAPCPSLTVHSLLSKRALFLVLETACMYGLHAYADKVPPHTALTNHGWNDSAVPMPYKGLCTHEAWSESLRPPRWFTAGLSPEEVDAARRERDNENARERYKERRDVMTAEQKAERNRKGRKQRASRQALETPEETKERQRKNKAACANYRASIQALETPEEREERRRKDRERKRIKKN